MAFTLRSAAFQEGAPIPHRYTGTGEDVSPPLEWFGEPAETRSFALIVEDPDAPRGVWTHWVQWNIRATVHDLPEGAKPWTEGDSGRNDFGHLGYNGPMPPVGRGVHRYFFRLYALDATVLMLGDSTRRQDLLAALKDHLIAEAALMGTFERSREAPGGTVRE